MMIQVITPGQLTWAKKLSYLSDKAIKKLSTLRPTLMRTEVIFFDDANLDYYKVANNSIPYSNQ